MSYMIGPVELPAPLALERINEIVRIRSAVHHIPKGLSKVFWWGTDKPRIRYTGRCYSSDALKKLENLKELFRNPSFNYPLYAKLDENFFFIPESFSWNKVGGFNNYFTFDLALIWYGTTANYVRGYKLKNLEKVDNDWGL